MIPDTMVPRDRIKKAGSASSTVAVAPNSIMGRRPTRSPRRPSTGVEAAMMSTVMEVTVNVWTCVRPAVVCRNATR